MESNQQLKDYIVAEFIASLDPNRQVRLASRDLDACLNILMSRRRYVNRFTLPPLRNRDTNNPAGLQAPPIVAPGLRNQGGGDRVVFNMENLVPDMPQHQLIARIGGGDAEGELPPLGGVQYFRGNNEAAGDLIRRHRAAMDLNFIFRALRGGAAFREHLRGMRRYQVGDGTNGEVAGAAAAAGAGDGPGVGPNAVHLGEGDGPRGMFPNFEQAQVRLRAHAGEGDGHRIQEVQVIQLGDVPGDIDGALIAGQLRGQARRRPRHRHIFNFVGQFLRDMNRHRIFFENFRAQILPVAVAFRPQHHIPLHGHDGGGGEVAQAVAQDGQRHEHEPAEGQEGGQPFADAGIEDGLIANNGGGQVSQHDHGNGDAPGNGHGFDRDFRQAAEDLWEPLGINGDDHDDNAQALQQGNGDNNGIGQMMDIQQPIQPVPGPLLALDQEVVIPLDRIRGVLVQIQERLATIVQQVDNYEKILHPDQHQDQDGGGHGDGDGDAA